MASASLSTYNRKRNFRITPEPAGKAAASRGAGMFVIQKHAASRLHYDFRLEWEGVLRSWAVPKGPSLDPAEKRMAVQVEDHPLSYGDFEGVIPPGQYGAGSVLLWDTGRWAPLGDAAKGLREGKLKFTLAGEKLKGAFMLVRMRPRGNERQPAWLLIKERDEFARSTQEFDVLEERAESVKRSKKAAGGKAKAKAKSGAGSAVTAMGKGRKKAVTKPAAAARTAAASQRRTSRSARGRNRAGGAQLPPLMAPQLATLVTAPPSDGDWIYELKLDGYRLLARIDGEDVRCFTRNGNDWSDRMPRIVQALRELSLPPCWLDGELVAVDAHGVPDFQRLQNAFEHHAKAELRYIAFDLLHVDGEDLRDAPQTVRSERLGELLQGLKKNSAVQASPLLEGEPAQLLKASRDAGFEGLMGKRADAPYRSGRSRDWIKLKAGLRQEFVIGGFTDPQGSRTGLGSLLLGVYDETGALRYAGNVGTGFDEETLQTLHARLSAIETPRTPFEDGPKRVGTKRLAVPHWVKPKLVAEVAFAGWTEGKSVRQAVFHGLREDKPPRQITLEKPGKPADRASIASGEHGDTGKGRKAAKAGRTAGKAAGKTSGKASKSDTTAGAAASPKPARRAAVATGGGVRITHPERVIDASTGITKGDVFAYYAAVSKLMLPHLANRPVAMLRAPAGVAGQQFFQKHADTGTLPQLDRLPKSLDPDHDPLLVIGNEAALLSAAQMNVLELHTWNATSRALEKPDRLIFDLDPGEGVTWKQVVESAQLVHTLLEELELKSFLKTSGGKGLHIVVPLKPSLGWDEVKEFSGDVVRHLSAILPQRFVAKSGPKNRVGRVFADFLRNGRGATTVAAWSARARPGVGISVPLWWKELKALHARPEWNVVDQDDRLDIGNAPWADYERSRQGLKSAMKALAAISKRARGTA